jgi:hypothetical protein
VAALGGRVLCRLVLDGQVAHVDDAESLGGVAAGVLPVVADVDLGPMK